MSFSTNIIPLFGTAELTYNKVQINFVASNQAYMYICFSGGKLCNAIKEEPKIASRFRFKKLLKESVISKY